MPKFTAFVLALLFICGCGPLPTKKEYIFPVQRGIQTPLTQSWVVSENKIFHNGNEITLKGISWFGFETNNLVVHGLWTGRSMDSFLKQIHSLGFNALRVPISPQAIDPNYPSQQGKPKAIDNLKELIKLAKDNELYVLIDIHNCNYNAGSQTGKPDNCGGYTLDNWYSNLKDLALLARDYDNIVGIDLYNEPYKLSWLQWRSLVNKGSEVILAVNSNLLIFVEGVGGEATSNNGYNAFWGENLVEAEKYPLSVPKNKLVFSPHTYGPSVYNQDYFSDPNFPNNMPKIWDAHFGFLAAKYPLAVGEFGGRYDGKDKIWQDAFIEYLKNKNMSFFYWCLNPNSGDTGGILLDDWQSVNQNKMKLLQKVLN